ARSHVGRGAAQELGAFAEDLLEGVQAERLLDHELHRLTGLGGGDIVVAGDDGHAHAGPPALDRLDKVPPRAPGITRSVVTRSTALLASSIVIAARPSGAWSTV